MLGLPDGVTACLFDLDGVLTDTAAVHDAAWKQTFDDFLQERADGWRLPPVRPRATTSTTSTASRAPTGVRDFLASRGITLPEGDPDDGPDAETVNGLGNRKNEELLRRIHDDGVKVFEGSRRYLEAARDAGLRRAVVSSSANTEDVLEVTGLARARRAAGRRRDDPRGEPRRQAGARHLPCGGPAARRRPPRRRRSSRTRSPGWRPAAPAGSALSSASTGSARPMRCGTTARASSSATWPSCLTR